ncbi:hypothetical protein BHF71_03505 [Vulcanibacillus modesticaldus]|uniref:Holin n=1 Tax=Vulcanibacillus modesticaldus TaxID=337097 RepID=A0A1D2YSW3_9BACI|nr:hypothetical protein [Vulcanibacillus modesticaldus]OEF98095.1 hypothetical protein BHF71_03505 [Vulcanibacillus modesticaldus]
MLEISIIIAMAMSLTPIISDWLKIHKKLRAWVNLGLIVLLNIFNSLLFGEGQIIEAMKTGIEVGVVTVGIYSTSKNTIQYMKIKKNNGS